MICPECNGRGEAIYYVEVDRDENSVTIEQRKGICRTCNGSGKKPMTNADGIRSMTDEELAELFCMIISEREKIVVEELSAKGVECTLVEYPILSTIAYLEWLQQPAEE